MKCVRQYILCIKQIKITKKVYIYNTTFNEVIKQNEYYNYEFTIFMILGGY